MSGKIDQSEAADLAKMADEITGQVFLKRRLKDDHTKYIIISINYSGIKDLARVHAYVARHALELWSDGPPEAKDAGAPVCKYHGPMQRSKKSPGWFCIHKMGDGTYCKEIAPP